MKANLGPNWCSLLRDRETAEDSARSFHAGPASSAVQQVQHAPFVQAAVENHGLWLQTEVRLRSAARAYRSGGLNSRGRGRRWGLRGLQLGELALYPNSRGLRIAPLGPTEIKEVRGCWDTGGLDHW